MGNLKLMKTNSWIDIVNASIDIKSQNTKLAYKRDLQQFVETMGVDLLSATESDFLMYFKNLEDRKYRYSTIARKITALSKYLDYLVIARKLDYNPINNIRKASRLYKNMDKRATVDIGIEDVRKVIRLSRVQTALIVQFLTNTGVRVSELIYIRNDDIKLNGEYAEIRVRGKGKKERSVYINMELYNRIKTIFNRKSDFLFHSVAGKQLIRQNLYKQVHNSFKKLTGKEVHPHTLRHFCATYRYVEMGEDIKAVSSYLGHSSCAITLDMYIDSKITPEKAMIV
ncbi:MAG: tyrosine-type recombinase/integrase [Planctomycetota bacterium]|jgi:integrase/recombinase XerD